MDEQELVLQSILANKQLFSKYRLSSEVTSRRTRTENFSPFKGKVPDRIFTDVYVPPSTDGSGRIRAQMRTAFKLLKSAGWELKNKVMTNVETGETMTFELLIYSPSTERLSIPIQKT